MCPYITDITYVLSEFKKNKFKDNTTAVVAKWSKCCKDVFGGNYSFSVSFTKERHLKLFFLVCSWRLFHIVCYLYGWYVLKLRLPCGEADFPTHCLKYCVCFFQLGGCTTIPESDLEERSIEQDSTELFTNHKHLIAETPMPGKKMGGLHQWYVRGSGTSGQFLSYQRTFCKAAYFPTSPSFPSTLVQLNLIVCISFSILKPLSLSLSLTFFFLDISPLQGVSE